MKKMSHLQDLLLVFILMTASTSFSLAQASKLSLADAKIQAAQLQKPLLVHFYANWCLPCQWMETSTFADPAVKVQLQRYVAVKIDVDEVGGYADKESCGVKYLPTILIFNASGIVMARFEETLNPEQMLEVLRKYDTPANRVVRNVPRIMPQGEGFSAPSAGQAAATLMADSSEDPAHLDALRHPIKPVSEPIKPQVRKMGVQVGVYSHYENVIRQVQYFEKKFYKALHISSKTLNGQTYYHLIAGPFDTPAQLQTYLSQLQREGIKGLIVDL